MQGYTKRMKLDKLSLCRKLPSSEFVQASALGNYQPFNVSGNIHQIARLKRLLNTLCGRWNIKYGGLFVG
jgi:hypothetical protein